MKEWLFLLGMGFLMAMSFLWGCAWHAWTHRCRPVDVHDLSEAYERGLADARTQRDEEIRLLSWMAQ